MKVYIRKKIYIQKGFTLVEILAYVAIFSLIIFTIIDFADLSLKSRLRDEAIAEVETAGNNIVAVISGEIRKAISITSPGASSTASSLILAASDPNISPVVFQLAGDFVEMGERGLATTSLNSSRVLVSNLEFTNLGRIGTQGAIRFIFSVEHYNPGQTPAFSYSQRFVGGASLRDN